MVDRDYRWAKVLVCRNLGKELDGEMVQTSEIAESQGEIDIVFALLRTIRA